MTGQVTLTLLVPKFNVCFYLLVMQRITKNIKTVYHKLLCQWMVPMPFLYKCHHSEFNVTNFYVLMPRWIQYHAYHQGESCTKHTHMYSPLISGSLFFSDQRPFQNYMLTLAWTINFMSIVLQAHKYDFSWESCAVSNEEPCLHNRGLSSSPRLSA
jgi:hypothetical protein